MSDIAAMSTQTTDASRDWWRRFVSFLLVLSVTAFSVVAGQWLNKPMIQPLTDDAPVEDFSAARAQHHVERIAEYPHPTGSAGAHAVREYLVAELRSLGLSVEVNRSEVSDLYGATLMSTSIENIVARLPGSKSSAKSLMLMSHYDSHWLSFGANDNGVGVATILETLRAVRARGELENDLVVAFTDGEELGLFGVRQLVQDYSFVSNIGMVLNFESRGSRGPVMMFETSPENGELIEVLRSASSKNMADSFYAVVYGLLPNGTDLSVTIAAEIAGLNFAYVEGQNAYHNYSDSATSVSMSTLQSAGEIALALTRDLGNRVLPIQKSSDTSYFSLRGHIIAFAPWLNWLLFGLCVFLLWTIAKRSPNLSGLNLATGFATHVISILFSLLAGGVALGFLNTWLSKWGVLHSESPVILVYSLFGIVGLIATYLVTTSGSWRTGLLLSFLLGALSVSIGELSAAAIVILLMGAAWFSVSHLLEFTKSGLQLGAALTWLIVTGVWLLFYSSAGHVLTIPLVAALFLLATGARRNRTWQCVTAALAAFLTGVWITGYSWLVSVGLLSSNSAIGVMLLAIPAMCWLGWLRRSDYLPLILTAVIASFVGAMFIAKREVSLPPSDEAVYYAPGSHAGSVTNQYASLGDFPVTTSFAASKVEPLNEDFSGGTEWPAVPRLTLLSKTRTGPLQTSVLRLHASEFADEVRLSSNLAVESVVLNGVPVRLPRSKSQLNWRYLGVPAQGIEIVVTTPITDDEIFEVIAIRRSIDSLGRIWSLATVE